MNPIIVWFRQDLRLADNPALRMTKLPARGNGAVPRAGGCIIPLPHWTRICAGMTAAT